MDHSRGVDQRRDWLWCNETAGRGQVRGGWPDRCESCWETGAPASIHSSRRGAQPPVVTTAPPGSVDCVLQRHGVKKFGAARARWLRRSHRYPLPKVGRPPDKARTTHPDHQQHQRRQHRQNQRRSTWPPRSAPSRTGSGSSTWTARSCSRGTTSGQGCSRASRKGRCGHYWAGALLPWRCSTWSRPPGLGDDKSPSRFRPRACACSFAMVGAQQSSAL